MQIKFFRYKCITKNDMPKRNKEGTIKIIVLNNLDYNVNCY